MAATAKCTAACKGQPAIRGGRPKIAGTGVTVRRLVGWYKMGMTPEDIALE